LELRLFPLSIAYDIDSGLVAVNNSNTALFNIDVTPRLGYAAVTVALAPAFAARPKTDSVTDVIIHYGSLLTAAFKIVYQYVPLFGIESYAEEYDAAHPAADKDRLKNERVYGVYSMPADTTAAPELGYTVNIYDVEDRNDIKTYRVQYLQRLYFNITADPKGITSGISDTGRISFKAGFAFDAAERYEVTVQVRDTDIIGANTNQVMYTYRFVFGFNVSTAAEFLYYFKGDDTAESTSVTQLAVKAGNNPLGLVLHRDFGYSVTDLGDTDQIHGVKLFVDLANVNFAGAYPRFLGNVFGNGFVINFRTFKDRVPVKYTVGNAQRDNFRPIRIGSQILLDYDIVIDNFTFRGDRNTTDKSFNNGNANNVAFVPTSHAASVNTITISYSNIWDTADGIHPNCVNFTISHSFLKNSGLPSDRRHGFSLAATPRTSDGIDPAKDTIEYIKKITIDSVIMTGIMFGMNLGTQVQAGLNVYVNNFWDCLNYQTVSQFAASINELVGGPIDTGVVGTIDMGVEVANLLTTKNTGNLSVDPAGNKYINPMYMELTVSAAVTTVKSELNYMGSQRTTFHFNGTKFSEGSGSSPKTYLASGNEVLSMAETYKKKILFFNTDIATGHVLTSKKGNHALLAGGAVNPIFSKLWV
jgi:hypothetical protein